MAAKAQVMGFKSAEAAELPDFIVPQKSADRVKW
jgi:hypothetical protein